MNPVKIMMKLLVAALVFAVMWAVLDTVHPVIVFGVTVGVGFVALMRARKRALKKRR